MKKLIFLSVGLSVFLLTGCGGGSSSSSSNGTSGTDNNTSQENNNSTDPNCVWSGDTLMVAEGKTCHDEDHTIVCQDDKVTVDGGINGPSVTFNGTTYTCQ